MSETIEGLNRDEWEEKLARIGEELERRGQTATLTVVGSAPGILAGQPERTSMDLDVWRASSQYDRRGLRAAVEAAGLLFDPRGDDPAGPYIQLVDAGIVQMGDFEPEPVDRYGGLQVSRPPIPNLIASKLLRANARDLSDIAWMMAVYQPDLSEVEEAVATFPRNARERATENLVYLQVLRPEAEDASSAPTPNEAEPPTRRTGRGR